MITVFLGIGSNLPGDVGSPTAQIERAYELLAMHPAIDIVEKSRIFANSRRPSRGGSARFGGGRELSMWIYFLVLTPSSNPSNPRGSGGLNLSSHTPMPMSGHSCWCPLMICSWLRNLGVAWPGEASWSGWKRSIQRSGRPLSRLRRGANCNRGLAWLV